MSGKFPNKNSEPLELTKTISKLLFLYDCVIIPDFGGFIGNYKPAELNETTFTLLPPAKDLIFNKQLSYNDGLLINYLAVEMNIPYSEAKSIVADEVAILKTEIESGGTVVLDGIGVFKTGASGQFEFYTDKSYNYLIESYGLPPVKLRPVDKQKFEKQMEQTLKNHSTMLPDQKKKILKGILIGAPIVALLIIIPLKTNILGTKNIQTSNLNPVATVDSNMQKPLENTSDSSLEKVIDETTSKRKALLYDETTSSASGKIYYLISGSFKSVENAEKQKAQLVSKGFDAKVLPEKNDLFRVAILRTEDKTQALQELEKLRVELGNQNIWLLTR